MSRKESSSLLLLESSEGLHKVFVPFCFLIVDKNMCYDDKEVLVPCLLTLFFHVFAGLLMSFLITMFWWIKSALVLWDVWWYSGKRCVRIMLDYYSLFLNSWWCLNKKTWSIVCDICQWQLATVFIFLF